MENKNVTANQPPAESVEVAERDSRELQDTELKNVSGGTIVLDQ